MTRLIVEKLLEHPAVSFATVLAEDAANGATYDIAYVVPHIERTNEAKALARTRDETARIAQWKTSFDLAYRSSGKRDVPDFGGWRSSLTNLPFPEEQMEEWLATTVERIRDYRPYEVFEIGCGVGLLVQALAPRCERYIGSDISPVAIARLRKLTASDSNLQNVSLLERDATALDDQPSQSFDTVILNSVIQYFPDITYLREVITAAVRIVRSGGHIIIGDVRHFGLLDLFQTVAQLSKAPAESRVGWLRRRISHAVQDERELVVDPAYFHDLIRYEPRICDVATLLKRGRFHNELTAYRYDVVLRIGEGERHLFSPKEEPQQGSDSVEAFDAQLRSGDFSRATLNNVQNRRLAKDLQARRQLRGADDSDFVGKIRELQISEANEGNDPEEFWDLGRDKRFNVCVSWTPHACDGRFDVTVAPSDRPGSCNEDRRQRGNACVDDVSSDPLAAAYRRKLSLELQKYLQANLPAQEVPAQVVAVDKLPTAC